SRASSSLASPLRSSWRPSRCSDLSPVTSPAACLSLPVTLSVRPMPVLLSFVDSYLFATRERYFDTDVGWLLLDAPSVGQLFRRGRRRGALRPGVPQRRLLGLGSLGLPARSALLRPVPHPHHDGNDQHDGSQ